MEIGHGASADELLSLADRALYAAKAAGPAHGVPTATSRAIRARAQRPRGRLPPPPPLAEVRPRQALPQRLGWPAMSLLVLAFEAALYPTLLAAVVILLSLERPKRLIAAYLAGGMTISITLGLLIVELLGGTNLVESQQSLLSWTGDLVIGGLAVLLAVALAMHADDRVRDRRSARRDARSRGRRAERRAVVAADPRARIGAGRVRRRAVREHPRRRLPHRAQGHRRRRPVVPADLGQILLFNVIMFLLAEIPLVGLIVAPRRPVRSSTA